MNVEKEYYLCMKNQIFNDSTLFFILFIRTFPFKFINVEGIGSIETDFALTSSNANIVLLPTLARTSMNKTLLSLSEARNPYLQIHAGHNIN